jgi:PadR family transcriptional regulator PadR
LSKRSLYLPDVVQDGILPSDWQSALGGLFPGRPGGLPTRRRLPACTTRLENESGGLERMPRRESPLKSEMVQGTLDMLVLRTLVLGPAHGHTIAHAIERGSEDILQIEHGSLYPALHRLEDRGWIASFAGTSENNRKAKYYRLTPAGRKQLIAQSTRWDQLVRAIGRIMNPA